MALRSLLRAFIYTFVPVCCASGAEIAPMNEEDTPIGYRWYGKRNGEAVVYEVVGRTPEAETFRSDTGCVWAHLPGDRYSPNVMWRDCGGAHGTQRVRRTGDAFPLAVGSRWQYRVEGSDASGNTWSGVRKCTIETTRSVEFDGLPREAFEVTCEDPWRWREWYVLTPENISVGSVSRSRDGRSAVWHEYLRHALPGE